jgi:hypothetical protein
MNDGSMNDDMVRHQHQHMVDDGVVGGGNVNGNGVDESLIGGGNGDYVLDGYPNSPQPAPAAGQGHPHDDIHGRHSIPGTMTFIDDDEQSGRSRNHSAFDVHLSPTHDDWSTDASFRSVHYLTSVH